MAKKNTWIYVLLGIGVVVGAIYTFYGCAISNEGCWYKNLGPKKGTSPKDSTDTTVRTGPVAI